MCLRIAYPEIKASVFLMQKGNLMKQLTSLRPIHFSELEHLRDDQSLKDVQCSLILVHCDQLASALPLSALQLPMLLDPKLQLQGLDCLEVLLMILKGMSTCSFGFAGGIPSATGDVSSHGGCPYICGSGKVSPEE
jgi:hypothetical protein